MGLTRTSLMVQAGDTDIREALNRVMNRMGFSIAAQDLPANLKLTLRRLSGCSWISISTEEFQGVLDAEAMARKLALALSVPALAVSVQDSDFLCLYLTGPGKGMTARAFVGQPCEEIRRPRPNWSAWQKVCPAGTDIRSILSVETVFAEDVLTPLGQAMGFPQDYALGLSNEGQAEVLQYVPSVQEPVFIRDCPPRLRFANCSPLPVWMDRYFTISIENLGGEGAGLDILLYGAFAEFDAVSFDQVRITQLQKNESWISAAQFFPDKPMRKVRMNGGGFGYLYTFSDFKMLCGIHPAQKRYTGQRLYDLKSLHGFSFAAIPHGDPRYVLDIAIAAYPHENPDDGAAAHNILNGYADKSDYLNWYRQFRQNMCKSFGSADIPDLQPLSLQDVIHT